MELITGEARRRHWATEQKLQIIEERFSQARRCRPWRDDVASLRISFIVGVVG